MFTGILLNYLRFYCLCHRIVNCGPQWHPTRDVLGRCDDYAHLEVRQISASAQDAQSGLFLQTARPKFQIIRSMSPGE